MNREKFVSAMCNALIDRQDGYNPRDRFFEAFDALQSYSKCCNSDVPTADAVINKAELVGWLEGRIGKSTVSRTRSHLFSRGQLDAFQEVLDHIKGEEGEG